MDGTKEQLQLFRLKRRRFSPIKIEIYHDEVYGDTKRPFGHQFLIIPSYSRDFFSRLLMNERKKVNGNYPSIRWHKLRKRSKSKEIVAMRWLKLLYDAMYNGPFGYIKDRKLIIREYSLGIKIGSVFIDSLEKLSNSYWQNIQKPSDKRIRKYESLLRMGIQGIIHYCFNPKYTSYSKVIITRICTDGKYGGVPIDSGRIIRKLGYNARNYIEIETQKIECIPKSKEKTPEVNFEELTDTVLGSTYYLCGEKAKKERKDNIVAPLRKVYEKRNRGGRGLRNSPHYRTFTVRYCNVGKDDTLNFSDWKVESNGINKINKLQRKFNF